MMITVFWDMEELASSHLPEDRGAVDSSQTSGILVPNYMVSLFPEDSNLQMNYYFENY
jgi:hypothetical protein